MGQVIVNEDWLFMNPALSPTNLTEFLQYYTGKMLDTFCPEKVCFVRPDEKPWITENIRILRRKYQREYEKRGKTSKYFELKQSYDEKLANEQQKYDLKL